MFTRALEKKLFYIYELSNVLFTKFFFRDTALLKTLFYKTLFRNLKQRFSIQLVIIYIHTLTDNNQGICLCYTGEALSLYDSYQSYDPQTIHLIHVHAFKYQ